MFVVWAYVALSGRAAMGLVGLLWLCPWAVVCEADGEELVALTGPDMILLAASWDLS